MLSLTGGNFTAISPQSVAAAVAAISPRPTFVEVASGGGNWLSPSSMDQSIASVQARSRRVLDELLDALRRALPPTTRVRGPTPRPPDVDFWRMADAPCLVLAGGSFGLAAAIAGRAGQIVRSPAAEHHLDLIRTRRPSGKRALVHARWLEYEYDVKTFG